ncbi:sugar transferase [bacterium]|nr:sugar transferase [bacterium]
MPKAIEKILLFLSDFFTINLAFLAWVGLRRNFGYNIGISFSEIVFISLLVFLFWILLFFFFGLYRSWYAQSRFDEFVALLKTITIGVVVIFLVTIDLRRDLANPLPTSRMMILSYWVVLLFVVGTGRMALRTFQRKLLELGIGVRNTIIVGSGNRAKDLMTKVQQYPALGYQVVGLVTMEKNAEPPPGFLGTLEQMPEIIKQKDVQEVLIALEEQDRQRVVEVIGQCNGLDVGLKIVPDLYDIVVGQARTNQIYGFPLIEILPELMPLWERRLKRLVDLGVALIVLVGFLPVWILVAILIKIDSRGPIFYKQERVGRNGKIFTMLKFRSMVDKAEELTGPVWADEDDPRITRVGKLIRRLRIDEVPQLINVLKGDMSLIGPRPERPFFVEQLQKEIPYYNRRLRVRPGITGWAQIKHEYDRSLDDVRKKLQYDLFYLENMSLRMDLKILLNTIHVMLRGKGQ